MRREQVGQTFPYRLSDNVPNRWQIEHSRVDATQARIAATPVTKETGHHPHKGNTSVQTMHTAAMIS